MLLNAKWVITPTKLCASVLMCACGVCECVSVCVCVRVTVVCCLCHFAESVCVCIMDLYVTDENIWCFHMEI